MRDNLIDFLVLFGLVAISIKLPVAGMIIMLIVAFFNVVAFCDDIVRETTDTISEQRENSLKNFKKTVMGWLEIERSYNMYFRFELIMRCMVENYYTIHINDDLSSTYVRKPFMNDRWLASGYFEGGLRESRRVLGYLLDKYNIPTDITQCLVDLDGMNLYHQGILDKQEYHHKFHNTYTKFLKWRFFYITPFFGKRKNASVRVNEEYRTFEPLLSAIEELNLCLVERDGEHFIEHKGNL